jgi:iron complex outermembrane recepter protein
MKVDCRNILLPLLALALHGTTQAQEPVVVSIHRDEVRGLYAPYAVNAVGAETMEEAGPRISVAESLLRLPGVFALDRQNYAQDLQLSIRGFGGRSTFGLRGVRVLVDGIPATMPDGQGQVSQIELSSAERIEVLRGPLAQLYGNASGGVMRVQTGIGGPDLVEGSADFGSYDTRRFGLRVRGEHGNMQGAAALSDIRTDGYREHSSAERTLFNTKLRFALAPNMKLTFVGNVFDQPNADDPTGLSREDFEQRPRSAAPIAIEQNARKSVRQEQAGLLAELEPAGAQTITARVYYGQRDLFQALALPLGSPPNDPLNPAGSGGIIDLDREYGGGAVQFAHRDLFGDGAFSLSVGIELDGMQERRRGYINDGGERGQLKRDEEDTVHNTDLYAQFGWNFAEKWSALAGLRRSDVRFRVEDDFIVPGNPDDSGTVRYRSTNPVVGLAYQPTAALNLYANYGHGFETPTFTEIAYRSTGSGPNFALDPARSRHAEIGFKYRPGAENQFDVALFHVRTRDELVVDTSIGGRTTYRNAAETTRRGVELLYAARLSPSFDAQLSWTVLDARFEGGEAATRGNRLPGVPRAQAYAELQWRPFSGGDLAGLSTAVEAVYLGRIAVDDENSDSTESSTRLNLRVRYVRKFEALRLTAYARLNNLTDERYAGSVIVEQAAGRYFEPAPERNWLIGLALQQAF